MNHVADELLSIVDLVLPKLHQIAGQEIAVRSDPKKWSRQEILGHLIDSACNNQQKFVRMMQQPHLEFPGYKQDDWVALQNWAGADWMLMIDLWVAYNRHLAYLIRHIDPKYYNNTITIEDTGPFELQFVVPDYVEHLKHHILQIFPEIDLTTKFVNVYNA